MAVFFVFFFTVNCTILILALDSAVFTDVLSEIFRLGSFAKKKERNVLRHDFLRNGYISLTARANETSPRETKACKHAAEE